MADGELTPQTVDTTLVAEADSLLERTVRIRRRLHAHPEVGLDLPATQQLVGDELAELGLDPVAGVATTSVLAVVEGGREGPTTLLRGDMDALPMPEDTGLDFASTVDGAMHACGHDAHVAMLLGAARVLVGRRAELAGRVVLMFQPGEEGHGGAQVMLDEGLLERYGPIDRAFAVHVTPMMPSGVVATRRGTLLASADEFSVTFTGRGGHASMPHDAVDPVPVACELVAAIQAMVTRRVPVFDPAVVTVTKIEAGTATNVIPESAVCSGTMRALSDGSRATILQGLHRLAEHIGAAHGCEVSVRIHDGSYPVTVNDSAAADRTLAVAAGLVGLDRVQRMPNPIMGAEDWSLVLQRVPGSMAFLGVGVPGVDRPEPNHSNRMVIDEPAMATGIALHAAMALAG
jgi:amidohydrolase